LATGICAHFIQVLQRKIDDNFEMERTLKKMVVIGLENDFEDEGSQLLNNLGTCLSDYTTSKSTTKQS
jgi:hypothetical protein